MLCFLWDQEGPIEQQYVGRILMDQPIYNTLGRSKTWFNQYLLVNEGFATASSMYKSFSSNFDSRASGCIWLFLPHTITSRSSRSSRIPASWHTNSGHRASLATSKRCFNKGGAAYFLARDQYVQKISKSKTRQDKWSIQRRNQRSLDPWGKPVKPRAKMGQVLLTQLLLPANWIVFQTTPDSKIQWIQFPHMVCSFNARDNPKRAKWLRMPGYFEWNS